MKASEIFPSGENVNSENESSGHFAYVNWHKVNVLWRNFRIWATMIVAMAWIMHTVCDEKRFYKDILHLRFSVTQVLSSMILANLLSRLLGIPQNLCRFLAQNY